MQDPVMGLEMPRLPGSTKVGVLLPSITHSHGFVGAWRWKMCSSFSLFLWELNHWGARPAETVKEQCGRCMGIGGDVLQRCGSLPVFSCGSGSLT
jgi:hypothetical protein